MAAIWMLAGALAAVAADDATVIVDRPGDRIDVAYEELARGRNHEAIDRINANRALEVGDPSALINLGTAHARLGRYDEASGYYKAAIISRVRYDLQLGDGRWMDSRAAARLAVKSMRKGELLTLR